MRFLVAVLVSLALHASVLVAWFSHAPVPSPAAAPSLKPLQVSLVIEPAKTAEPVPANQPGVPPAKTSPNALTRPLVAAQATVPRPVPDQAPVSMAAPPAPSAEEWAMASTYTLKNSKRYRYNWGQQVRSMMGTVVEGPQQGHVRLRIEIAPDGKVAKVETLWSTSEVATRLARQAIESLPPLPPTPTGQPLVFEQTIAYVPYESGWPPIYKYDCLPEAPKFQNPFVWDGKSPQSDVRMVAKQATPTTVQPTSTDCPNDAQPDSLEAEAADIKRQFDFWGSRPLNGVK
jgi:TonB family protein